MKRNPLGRWALILGALSALVLAGCEGGEGEGEGDGEGGGSFTPGGGNTGGGNTGGGNTGGDVVLGEQLYTQYCAACHGDEGAGGPIYGGSIQGNPRIPTMVANGGGGMPAFPQLDNNDVAAIEAWLASFLGPPDMRPGGPAEIFSVTCAGCHGTQGQGSARGPQIQNPVVGFATWVVRNGRSRADYRDEMPMYGTNELTPEELTGVLSWLGNVPKPTDGPGLFTRYCANCHGASGSGGPVGVGIRGEADELGEIVRQGHGGTNYANRRSYMPRWTAAELSNTDLSKIAQTLGGGGGD